MKLHRGDVVLVDFPYSTGGKAKVRPALVIQNNQDNSRLANTIITQITTVRRRSMESTQVLVEVDSPAGRESGLRQDSVVNCVNIATLAKRMILRKLGTLPDSSLARVDQALAVAIGLRN
jgi:mRNA interferase MazF